jgi:hypothetical protein
MALARSKLLLIGLIAAQPALATEIQPSARFPSDSYIGEGWPASLTDGCIDRGTCRLPGLSNKETTVATIAVPDATPAGRKCHPSYAGACVPSVPGDLDCDHLTGPVRVIGPDVFGLDPDHDGLGCEAK